MYVFIMLLPPEPGINMAEQTKRRKQAEKSGAMRRLLIEAATESLIDIGYAKTTAVEVCRRAGVTRGALFHHFDSLAALLAEAMSDVYDRNFFSGEEAEVALSLDQWIDRVWAKLQRPEFKAVIEIWFAARNDPEMAEILRPSILKYAAIFSVSHEVAGRKRPGATKELKPFFYLARETMLGLALGRATTPRGNALQHEQLVIETLKRLGKSAATA